MSVSKAFKITLGIVLGLFVAFVVLPVAGCLFCGACVAAMAPTAPTGTMGRPSALATAVGGVRPEPVAAQLPPEPASGDGLPEKLAQLLPPHDFNAGEAFKLASFSYRVTRMREQDAIGSDFARLEAGPGAFFVVAEYEETNNGGETVTVLEGNMELADAEGRTFQPSSRAMATLAMSGQAELALAQLHPGVTRRASVAFELPDGAVPVLLVVRARGLAPGAARVLAMTADEERGVRALVVERAIPALRERDFVKVRSLMHSQDAASTTDAALATMADALDQAEGAMGDREAKMLAMPTVSGDLVTSHTAFVRRGRRWTKADGGRDVIAREVGGRYYFVRVDVSPPRASGARRSGKAPR